MQPEYDYVEREKYQLIEVKIKKISQLFNSLDPSPFLEKDLDDDAFEYIVSSVAEHHIKTKQRIIIHLPKKEMKKISEHEVRKAIHHHFEYKRMLAERDVNHKIEEGQLSFLIGVSFLAICLFLSNWISTHYTTLISNILVEGLIISGWVAMWKPISNILYDWWPMNKQKRTYDKISKMDVELKAY